MQGDIARMIKEATLEKTREKRVNMIKKPKVKTV